MTRRIVPIAVPLALLTLSLALHTIAARGAQNDASGPPNAPTSRYQREARLLRPVSIREAIYQLGRLSDDLAKVAGADLVAQSTVEQRKLAIRHEEAPAADLMAALEVVAGARWKPVGSRWILTDTPGLERLSLLDDETKVQLSTKALAPLQRLTPRQAQLLQMRGILTPEDLTPVQREALLAAIQHDYFRFSYHDPFSGPLAPESLELRNVILANSLGHPAVSPGSVAVIAKLASGLPEMPCALIPSENFQIVPPGMVGGTPPIRAARLLPLGPLPPTREANLAEDPRLDVPVPIHDASLLGAAAAAANAAKVNLVAGTLLEELRPPGARLASLPPNLPIERRMLLFPARKEGDIPRLGPPAREVMEAVAERTGGTWRVLGSSFVLQPNSQVERVARLTTDTRQEWLQRLMVETEQSLSSRQRDTLRVSGKIAGTELSDKQKSRLSWITALAFVGRLDVPATALRLEGVSLERQAKDEAADAPALLQFMVPRSKGTVVVVGAVSLK